MDFFGASSLLFYFLRCMFKLLTWRWWPFCFVGMAHRSIGSVFRDLHGFNTGEMGTAFLAVLVGVIFGFASTLHQERLYQCVYL